MSTPKAQREQVIALNELLLEEGDEFVEAAYMALLKRRPDATGGRTYLRALRNGTSKVQILHKLFMSSECHRDEIDLPGLNDEFMREGFRAEENEESVAKAASQAAEVTHAEQLLVLDDTDKFIELAYWVLLRRAPDSEGVTNCHGRLREGAGKIQILYELFASPECRELEVELPGLRDAFAQEGLHVVNENVSTSMEDFPQAAKTLAELLSHQGGRFVECAYLTLLKRAPDSQGFQHRLGQVRDGTSKVQILSEMSTSKEAIAAAVPLPGLAAAITLYHLSRTPIFGRFVKLFISVEGDSVAERRWRAAEQRLLTLAAELGEQLEHINSNSSFISAMKQKVLVHRQDVDGRIASLEKSVAALRQLIERYDGQGSVSEPAPSKAGVVKYAGRLALDLRAEEIARDLRRVR